ncbi:MAG TPA: transglutaminase domain-containing protein [Capsulimonadaceae bacterium]|jgi:transglutaminase-like putative cysteine protease
MNKAFLSSIAGLAILLAMFGSACAAEEYAAVKHGQTFGMGSPATTPNPSRVTLKGSAKTAGDMTTTIIIHVPRGVQSLKVNIPLPANINLVGWRQSAGTYKVTSVPVAASSELRKDAYGNAFQVLSFTDPAYGDIVVTADMKTIGASVDLNLPLPAAPFPLRSVPDDIALYTKPTSMAQSDNAAIIDLSKQLTTGAKDEAAAVRQIASWVFANIAYSNDAPVVANAAQTLETKSGQCRGYAYLFAALARAAGIPVRGVCGYTVEGSTVVPLSDDGGSTIKVRLHDVPHAWVEVWYPEGGWVPYDPQLTAGFLDIHHVRSAVAEPTDYETPIVEWTGSGEKWRNLSYDEDDVSANFVDTTALAFDSGNVTTSRVLLERRIASLPTKVSSSNTVNR